MRFRALLFVALLAACGQSGQPLMQAPAADAPGAASGAVVADPARRFPPANDAARATTGEVTLRVSGGESGGEAWRLSGARGFAVEAALDNVAAPASLVEGQTLRALMQLSVGASQTLVYRVTRAAGPALCDGGAATHIVVYDAGEVFAVLPLRGGAPGDASARACAVLRYSSP